MNKIHNLAAQEDLQSIPGVTGTMYHVRLYRPKVRIFLDRLEMLVRYL